MNSTDNLKSILAYTKSSNSGYHGKNFETGYHTLEVNGETLPGQRNPLQRLENVPYDFTDKVVLDIGSNQGGMLFALKDVIAEGVGVDYDYRLVNAANALSTHYESTNTSFYVHDLDKDPIDLINSYTEKQYDIVFLLAVCMWIKSWKETIRWVSQNSKHCLFESNGTPQEQSEQVNELSKYYDNVTLINEKSLDDPKQHARKLYLCH